MEFNIKYRLMLWKTYVDRGRGLTSYFNEIFLILGVWQIATYKSPLWVLVMILGYGILTFIGGWGYFNFGWEILEKEVANQYNFFQKEVREALKIKNVV